MYVFSNLQITATVVSCHSVICHTQHGGLFWSGSMTVPPVKQLNSLEDVHLKLPSKQQINVHYNFL